jgi:transcriptional regulator with XRE-family HTH domain
MPRRQPPTVRLRRLAAELRELRTAAGLTREDVTSRTNINAATLYKIEKSQAKPQLRTLLALLDTYDVDQSRRDELVTLSKQAGQLGWLQSFEAELPEQLTNLISFEAEAREARNFEQAFVPGLLQTEPYARALISGMLPGAAVEDIDSRVHARVQRQALLAQPDPIKLWAIIDESVLHRTVGGPGVMRDQLNHVIQAATTQPHLTLQVVPFGVGSHPGLMGSFVILSFPDPADPELVYLESGAGDLFLESDTDVRRHTSSFDYLRAAALNPNDSLRLIRTVSGTLETEGE